MSFLLDVNVLVALVDPRHVTHEAAHRWFERDARTAWATCPTTENGIIRVLSHPAYPNSPGPPSVVAEIVRRLTALPGHQFWPDDLSLVAPGVIDTRKILGPRQITDTYLLALAAVRGGQLATFDLRLSPNAVDGGRRALTLIGSDEG